MINYDLIKTDFYEAVNGEHLKELVIPEDRPATGGFNTLAENTEKTLIEDLNSLKNPDKNMEKFLKLYNMAKDDENKKRGLNFLKTIVSKIENTNSYQELQQKAREFFLEDILLPVNFFVYSDMKNAKINALYLETPSIILPDKTYYGTEKADSLLAKYKETAEKILSMYGYEKEKIAKLLEDTFKFDSLIYPNVKSSEENADYIKMYNVRTLEEVEKYSTVINITDMAKKLVGENLDKIIVTDPRFFESFNKVLTSDNFEVYKSWSIVKTILSSTSILSEEFRIAGGAYSRFLSGVDKAMNIEKYAYHATSSNLDDIISIYYGEKYFGPKAKEDVKQMALSMVDVYRKRLNENKWLNKETIKSALRKLEIFDVWVGYPDKIHEIYNEIEIDEEKSYAENVHNISKTKEIYALSRWNKEVDKKWGMSSNIVNAYYSPTQNIICFPAAILQAPFYSLTQTKSENYGGIGAVMGHEISHAFDNNGSQMDEYGNINNWWQKEDYEKFDELAKDMINQFEGIPFGSSKVNGTLTVSENIADAGGLSCALEALKNTGEYNLKEFFVNWAKVWCMKAKEQYIDLLLSIDVHAPAKLRANMQVKNLQEFYDTFDVKEGDPMYLAEDKRVNIW